MRPSHELVLAKVAKLFPPDQQSEALALLAQYGTETWHPEVDRVHLAILKLSGGDIKELQSVVEMAKSDFRDALAWAEYPGQMKSGASFFNTDATSLRRIEREDREQYEKWLRGE